MIATGDNRSIGIWNAQTGELLRKLEEYDISREVSNVRAVAWAPDGLLLAAASDDGTVRIWGMPSD